MRAARAGSTRSSDSPRTEEQEKRLLERIQRWVRDSLSDGPAIRDWDWDGTTLSMFHEDDGGLFQEINCLVHGGDARAQGVHLRRRLRGGRLRRGALVPLAG